MRLALLFTAFASAASAQGVRDSDILLDADEMASALSGHVVEFFDGSKSHYAADGAYRYTYTDGEPPFRGTYEVNDQSGVCVTFDNGFSRCDMFVRSGERLVLIIDDGTRFPVRRRTPN